MLATIYKLLPACLIGIIVASKIASAILGLLHSLPK
jgi:hypothetical protein